MSQSDLVQFTFQRVSQSESKAKSTQLHFHLKTETFCYVCTSRPD